MNSNTKKLTSGAMLCAIAYVVMVIGRVPVILFLKYDPKDVIITLGGLNNISVMILLWQSSLIFINLLSILLINLLFFL